MLELGWNQAESIIKTDQDRRVQREVEQLHTCSRSVIPPGRAAVVWLGSQQIELPLQHLILELRGLTTPAVSKQL